MPQNNVLPDWRATYPNDAPVQKPPGVTVSTTATAPRVPNKFVYTAGTIQSYDPELGKMVFKEIVERKLEEKVPQPKAEAGPKPKPDDDEDEEEDEDEDEDEPKGRGKPHRR